MPDIFELISRWWKRMLAVIFLSLLAVGIITFLKPRKYLSVATAVPASSIASDKARIFNQNIEALYSTLGSPDDLDRILGTGNLDTIYIAVAQQFNLREHYKIKGNNFLIKTAVELKRKTRVMKSEFGELKVKVWDTDKNLAPQLANSIMDVLQAIHQDLQSAGNEATLTGLIKGKNNIHAAIDSISNFLRNTDISSTDAEQYLSRRALLNEQRLQYEKLIGEYQVLVDSKPPVLIIVEKARVAIRPDKPKRMQIMIATAVLSFLFALLAALVMERRKSNT